MLANQIKKYKEVSFTVIKLDLIQGHKDSLTYATNQCDTPMLTKKTENTWSFQ